MELNQNHASEAVFIELDDQAIEVVSGAGVFLDPSEWSRLPWPQRVQWLGIQL